MAVFVLNDEKAVNTYGFRTRTSGIDLKRFKQNPVMLDAHQNSNQSVLGRWQNIKVNNDGTLTAEDDFDADDPQAMAVKGKVDRGFVKGCSMGLRFDPMKITLQKDGIPDLLESELMESSICPVPSSAGSLRLYSMTGELMTEDQVKLHLSALSASNPPVQNKPSKMEKIVLSAIALTALGFKTSDEANDPGIVSAAIEKLAAQYNAEKTARESLQAQLDKQVKDQATALVDGAILAGKITADLKDQFVQMATSNYELATKCIAGMAGKHSLPGVVNTGKAAEVKSLDEFQKLSFDAQLAYKLDHPDEYKALVG